jgi:hypothetical protein
VIGHVLMGTSTAGLIGASKAYIALSERGYRKPKPPPHPRLATTRRRRRRAPHLIDQAWLTQARKARVQLDGDEGGEQQVSD